MYLLLHGARVDETPSARGPIADQFYDFWQVFYRAKISSFPGRPDYGIASPSGKCRTIVRLQGKSVRGSGTRKKDPEHIPGFSLNSATEQPGSDPDDEHPNRTLNRLSFPVSLKKQGAAHTREYPRMPPISPYTRAKIRARNEPGYMSFASPPIFDETMIPKNAVILREFMMVLRRELMRQYGATLQQPSPGVSPHRERYPAQEGVIRGP